MRKGTLLAYVVIVAVSVSTAGCAFIDKDLRDQRACQGLVSVTQQASPGTNAADLSSVLATPGLSAQIRSDALPYASARLGRDLHTVVRLTGDLDNGVVAPSPALALQLQTAHEKVSSRCLQVLGLGAPDEVDPSEQARQEDAGLSSGTDTKPGNGNQGDQGSDQGQTAGLSGALDALRLAPEQREGYDRALFTHWSDANGNGCDTRREVLIRDSLTPVTVGPGCELSGGSWYSVYDGFTSGDPGDFDIDHVVPLAEAWDSGASTWSDQRREEFANDMSFPGSLLAVSAGSNRSKSDRDPAEWLPPEESFHCEYFTLWVEIKIRWDLSVDDAELNALEMLDAQC